MEESDAAVIAASLGEPGYFGVLFDRYGGLLLRFLARRVDPAEAEALLGDVFRIAFERRASFHLHRECARPWLYGIAANVVSKHRRAEARRFRATLRLAGQAALGEDPADQAARSADAASRWGQLGEAIAALPERDRQALLLFAWEELSYEEIAEALGIPTGTVRSRLNRARARLAASVRRDEPDAAASLAQRTTP
jgi:RNA polymerase sigma-70 factor (ECF subfamily)